MYCMAFVHYILTFHWVLVDNHRSETLRHTLIDCIQALDQSMFPGVTCNLDVDAAIDHVAAANDTALAALLLINVRPRPRTLTARC